MKVNAKWDLADMKAELALLCRTGSTASSTKLSCFYVENHIIQQNS